MNGTRSGAAREASGPLAERALLFELAGRSYALRITSVEGLGEPGSIRSVPGAPATVLGLCEWRGRLLTVLDLPALLGAGPAGAVVDGRVAEPCLVRLAAPLERTALYLPAPVRLGWIASGPEPSGAARPCPAPEGERANPQFLDPRSLVRGLAAAVGR